jgi:superfamily I DNA and RNA helicase
MLEIVTGQRRNAAAERILVRTLEGIQLTGTLYIGYPIIGSTDEPVLVQALLTTLEHGVVVFEYAGEPTSADVIDQISERQNDLHAAIHQKLFAYRPLRAGRKLAIDVHVVTMTPVVPRAIAIDRATIIASPQSLATVLADFPPLTEEHFRAVNAAIQRISTIKPPNKRTKVTRNDSRGAIMQQIEREIANLDQWQKKAAIESPDGPQRIRGLAGCGKTVVLALKAAYLHARNPEWDIVVTFHTRALYQQFKDLIRRFCFEQLNDEPDWSKLRLLHAWGSARQAGVYSEIAAHNGLPVNDFSYARQKFTHATAFGGVCDELLIPMKQREPTQLFDAILIDEAQDLPQSFFELVYLSTREPKRVVWAYDELQNLGAYTMRPPSELFGLADASVPRVPDLQADETGAKRDIILPVCYRNTPWALTTAHAIGFGIYRKEGLVQFFDEPQLWFDVGYMETEGRLRAGERVTLARQPESSPIYFKDLLSPEDAVQCFKFGDRDEQAEWVATAVRNNITTDELDERDILIILADPLTARREAGRLIGALDKHGLTAHLAGVGASVDQLFQDGSIAITGIFRAKGNEAPMVYILNADYGSSRLTPIKGRNTLFTAITRSRAWVRLCGTGTGMDDIAAEIDSVRSNDFRLSFQVPTAPELKRLRKIHRDISKAEIDEAERIATTLSDAIRKIRSGDVSKDLLPKALRADLASLLDPDEEE